MTRTAIISDEIVSSQIFRIRDKNVMLDNDLAKLYDVETKYLKRQVKRNIERFPEDFMFELSAKEFAECQPERSAHGGTRILPMAFTEQGIAMLSGVLSSKKAIAINIQIMRVFTRMRETILSNKEIFLRLEQFEKSLMQQRERVSKNELHIEKIIEALKKVFGSPAKKKTQRSELGYKTRGR